MGRNTPIAGVGRTEAPIRGGAASSSYSNPPLVVLGKRQLRQPVKQIYFPVFEGINKRGEISCRERTEKERQKIY